MIKLAIIDDSPEELQKLSELISAYFLERKTAFEVVPFSDGLTLFEHYPRDVDVFFLDVEMKPMNGIEIAHRIRSFDSDVCLLFYTSFPKYAVTSYDVEAFDYILKPTPYGTFSLKMDRVLRLLEKKESQGSFYFHTGGGVLKINLNDVLYFMQANHTCFCHTLKETVTSTSSLKKINEQIDGFDFVRCNSSFLVNMKFIKAFHKDQFILLTGEAIPLSRQMKKECLQRFADYIGGK
jgi:DNA-binding LytR/AlgR family response regulator